MYEALRSILSLSGGNGYECIELHEAYYSFVEAMTVEV